MKGVSSFKTIYFNKQEIKLLPKKKKRKRKLFSFALCEADIKFMGYSEQKYPPRLEKFGNTDIGS